MKLTNLWISGIGGIHTSEIELGRWRLGFEESGSSDSPLASVIVRVKVWIFSWTGWVSFRNPCAHLIKKMANPCAHLIKKMARSESESYLVDPASSHMLASKIKPCMSKYKLLYGETANGSLNQLQSKWFYFFSWSDNTGKSSANTFGPSLKGGPLILDADANFMDES